MNLKKTLTVTMLITGILGMKSQEFDVYQKKTFSSGTEQLRDRLLLPENFDASQKYPLLLFLHGGGERGADNEKQLTHGAKLFLEPRNRGAFPAVILVPQCPEESYWAQVDIDRSHYPIGLDFHYENGPTAPLDSVIKLVQSYLDESYIDKDRVYIMGLSMGGMGTFEMLYRMPDVFAAGIPICGAGVPETASVYAKKTPLWVFHGAKDQVVGPEHSVQMVEALLKAGANPSFTLFDNYNHNSWDGAFAEPELLPWLFSHRKKPTTN
jgi:predicted peptidase